MMRALVALCVRHYGTLTALTVVALALGSWSALRAPLDVTQRVRRIGHGAAVVHATHAGTAA